MDSGVSNHMMGSKAAFSELNDDVTGKVKFGEAQGWLSESVAPSSSGARMASTAR